MLRQVITISMVLKFFLHQKHLPRLVLGLTAVWNLLHKGHRKRKKPSLILDGIANSFLIKILDCVITETGKRAVAKLRFPVIVAEYKDRVAV